MENFLDILTLTSSAPIRSFKKGEIIQHANDSNASAFYVKKGLLRSYVIDAKGKEHIYMFAPEGWITGDIEAMEYKEPIQLYIDCLEDSEVIAFDKDFISNPDLSKQQIAESAHLLYRRIGRLQRRVLMLMGAPAIDRYQYFVETYPELPQRVPQRMIASFLGIAPQTLSTLRSKMFRSE